MTIFTGFKKTGFKKSGKTDTKTPVEKPTDIDARTKADKSAEAVAQKTKNTKETGGPKGLEPTRYGDWEKSGRCIDF